MVEYDVVAITGFFGSGKTTAAKNFRKIGGAVIDADAIGHRLLRKKKKTLVDIFGRKILTRGNIDRRKLGELCFSDPHELKVLNSIMHPLIISEIIRIIQKNKKKKLIFIDAAPYYELQLNHLCDYTIVVSAKKNLAERRILKSKRFDKKDIVLIRKRQKPIKEKDIHIINNGTKKQLEKKVRKIWKKLRYMQEG